MNEDIEYERAGWEDRKNYESYIRIIDLILKRQEENQDYGEDFRKIQFYLERIKKYSNYFDEKDLSEIKVLKINIKKWKRKKY